LVGTCEKQARGFLGGALRCLACSESPSQKKKEEEAKKPHFPAKALTTFQIRKTQAKK
jgi:hypothetical protein